MSDAFRNPTEAIMGGINWLECRLGNPRRMSNWAHEGAQFLPYVFWPTDNPDHYRVANWRYAPIGSNLASDQIGMAYEDYSGQEIYIPPKLFKVLKTPGKDGIYLYSDYSSVTKNKKSISAYLDNLRWVFDRILEVPENAALRKSYR